MRIVWSLLRSVPFDLMKLSRLGICSRSDGTFGLSRRRCTLSNWKYMTCLIRSFGEFRSHDPIAGPGGPGGAADTDGAATAEKRMASKANRTTGRIRRDERFIEHLHDDSGHRRSEAAHARCGPGTAPDHTGQLKTHTIAPGDRRVNDFRQGRPARQAFAVRTRTTVRASDRRRRAD